MKSPPDPEAEKRKQYRDMANLFARRRRGGWLVRRAAAGGWFGVSLVTHVVAQPRLGGIIRERREAAGRGLGEGP
jgi:hypothetical protein